MAKIFLDIGNTRIKWSAMIEGQYEYGGTLVISEFLATAKLTSIFGDLKLESVFIAAVNSQLVIEKIKSKIQSYYQILPVLLTAQKDCCGLTSGYDDFHRLGSDRWMALQGAHAMFDEPIIIVDAGTAMTIDVLIDGRHLGGFIVPGLSSLRSSLSTDTAELTMVDRYIGSKKADKLHSFLATDTESAILGGTLYMTAAFINTIVADLNKQVKACFKLVMTGGNAATLLGLLDGSFDYIPDLVLKGMINIEGSIEN